MDKFKIPDDLDYHNWGVLLSTKDSGINARMDYKVYLWCRDCGAIRADEVQREGEDIELSGGRHGYGRVEKSAKHEIYELPNAEKSKKIKTCKAIRKNLEEKDE